MPRHRLSGEEKKIRRAAKAAGNEAARLPPGPSSNQQPKANNRKARRAAARKAAENDTPAFLDEHEQSLDDAANSNKRKAAKDEEAVAQSKRLKANEDDRRFQVFVVEYLAGMVLGCIKQERRKRRVDMISMLAKKVLAVPKIFTPLHYTDVDDQRSMTRGIMWYEFQKKFAKIICCFRESGERRHDKEQAVNSLRVSCRWIGLTCRMEINNDGRQEYRSANEDTTLRSIHLANTSPHDIRLIKKPSSSSHTLTRLLPPQYGRHTQPVLLIIRGIDGLCTSVDSWQTMMRERPNYEFYVMWYIDLKPACFTNVFNLERLMSNDDRVVESAGLLGGSSTSAIYLRRRLLQLCRLRELGTGSETNYQRQSLTSRSGIKQLYTLQDCELRHGVRTPMQKALPFDATKCKHRGVYKEPCPGCGEGAYNRFTVDS